MRECDRCGAGPWSRASSEPLIRDVAVIRASLRSFLANGQDPLDIQVFPVVARLGGYAASQIEPETRFEILGIDLVASRLNMLGKLLRRSEETRSATVNRNVDTEPLAPPAVDLADVDHAGKHRLAVLRHGLGRL